MLVRHCGQESGLAAGAGAQIEPALTSGDRSGTGQGERHELGSLVLHAHRATGTLDRTTRIAPWRHEGGRCVGKAGFPRLGQPRKGDECHIRRGVVGLEERLQLLATALRRESTAQSADHPHRVRGAQRQPLVVGPRVLLDARLPFFARFTGDPAENRVREARRSSSGFRGHEVHGLVDGRVRGDTRGEQLMHREAQRIEDGGVDAVRRAICRGGDDRVIGAEAPQRAVGQLGGESRILGVSRASAIAVGSTRFA